MLELTTVQLLSVALFVLTSALLVLAQVGREYWISSGAACAAFATVLAANYYMLAAYRGEVEPDLVIYRAASLPVPEAERIKDCAECPELVTIEPGYFVMGANTADGSARPQERPQVKSRIGRRFAIGVHEITEIEYEAFRASTNRSRVSCGEGPGGNTAARAAHCISWADAKAYATWLSHQTGERYRLPTAAEWEYAARGGDARASAGAANGYGLHGIGGNVAELVEDCWVPSLADAPTDGSAAQSEGRCARRMVKDAYWSEPEAHARLTARRAIDPGRQVFGVGFRVVRELETRIAYR